MLVRVLPFRSLRHSDPFFGQSQPSPLVLGARRPLGFIKTSLRVPAVSGGVVIHEHKMPRRHESAQRTPEARRLRRATAKAFSAPFTFHLQSHENAEPPVYRVECAPA